MAFNEFLEGFIKKTGLTNGKFADKLDVPSATISHLLSGRNKPSLDFITRLIKAYPSLDLYEITGLKEYDYSNKYTAEDTTTDSNKNEISEVLKSKEIEKVILFYKDGSFEEYNNKK